MMVLNPSIALAQGGAIADSVFGKGIMLMLSDLFKFLTFVIGGVLALYIGKLAVQYILAQEGEKEQIKLQSIRNGQRALVAGVIGMLASTFINLVLGYFGASITV